MTFAGGHDQQALAFEEHGTGQPVLLLHGFPLNRTMWRPQVAALSATHRLIAPDLPGFGESRALPPSRTIAGMAAAARDLLNALGVERAALCGLSMGGYVALAFAHAFPDRVAALMLADTAARPDDPQRQADRTRRIALIQGAGMAPFAAEAVPPLLRPRTAAEAPAVARRYQAMVESTPIETVVAALEAIRDRPDLRPALPVMPWPALVLVGEHDPITPPAWSEELAAALPAARLVVLPGAGHMANVDAAERFNTEILAFLRGVAYA